MKPMAQPKQGASRLRKLWLFAGITLVAGGVLAGLLLFDVLEVRTSPSEPTRSLRGWIGALRAHYQEHRTYPTALSAVGFSPERGNRYACFSGPGPLEDRSGEKGAASPEAQGIAVDTLRFPDRAVTFAQLPEDVSGQLGVAGNCPRCSITLACAARLHLDGPLDIWTLSTGERQLRDGTIIPPDELYHDVDGQ